MSALTFTTPFITTGVNDWRNGYTCLRNPTDPVMAAAHRILMEKAEAKCAAHISIRMDSPRRPRSTGWKSQSHHLHGHIRQLCEPTGYTMAEMKQIVKEDTSSWPVEFKKFRGKRRTLYASEADISVEVCAEAIEICHRIAADLNVRLIEEASDEA